MKYRKVLDRRTFLRGAGGAVVGLPFLEEMRSRSAFAAPDDAPVRAFNLFFGLGYQREIQADGMRARGGVLPIQPLIDKFGDRLSFLTGVNQINGNGDGNAHYDGSSVAFTGTSANRLSKSKNVTGGISMDQALRMHVHPDVMPAGVFKGINTGTWWRFSDSSQRYIHSRNSNGQPAGDPVPPQTPKELFAKVFGNFPGGMMPPKDDTPQVDPAEIKALAMRHSVLDAVMDQYKHFTSPAGNLSQSSQVLVKDHLDHVRTLEREVAEFLSMKDGSMKDDPVNEPREPMCNIPEGPGNGAYSYRNGGDGDGIDVTVDKLAGEVRLMARLFAAGIACDRIRFGSFVFQSGGERIRLKGRYTYDGKTVADFDDPKNLNGKSDGKGSGNCSHEFWHRNDFDWCRRHLHFVMDQFAYLFTLMDGIQDPNGKSVFDNAMLTVSTESGNGQHKSAEHELQGVFHIINGAGGRFKVGGNDFIDVGADGIDLYNTMLMGMGVPRNKRLWDGRGDISSKILV